MPRPPSVIRLRRIAIAALLVAAGTATARSVDPVRPEAEPAAPVPLRTGSAFRNQLDETIPGVRWRAVPFRRAVRRLADGAGLAVVVDRRLDPSREIEFEATGATTAGLFGQLAARAGGETRVVGSTLYLGPPEPAAKLRTLVALRTEEGLARFPGGEAALVARRRTIRWDDLDTPADVLDSISTAYGVRIDGLDTIPHDLWAAATLAEATLVESLSLVLVQFDRTFAWDPEATAVRIVPIPEAVAVERLHRPPAGKVPELVADWRKRFPQATVESAGRSIRLIALVEQHELAERLLRGDDPAAVGENAPPDPSPLDRQRFTLKLENVPLAALMKSVEKQAGITFAYDTAALGKAGVDLATQIDVDVRDATPAEFFEAMFEPVKVDFEIEGKNVRLTVRE